jgi:hypothetical protein
MIKGERGNVGGELKDTLFWVENVTLLQGFHLKNSFPA